MSFIEPGLFDMIVRLRSRGISDTNVLRAMETIPRSAFVAPYLKPDSYEERELPIPCGQIMLAPMSAAILLQSLEVEKNHKILQVGAGTGYITALLAALGKRVYGVERYRELTESAERNARRFADNAVIRHGDGRYGWRGQMPFDRILVCGAMRILPNALIDQLAPGGIMVIVIEEQLVVAKKRTRKVTESEVLPLTIPWLEPGKSKAL